MRNGYLDFVFTKKFIKVILYYFGFEFFIAKRLISVYKMDTFILALNFSWQKGLIYFGIEFFLTKMVISEKLVVIIFCCFTFSSNMWMYMAFLPYTFTRMHTRHIVMHGKRLKHSGISTMRLVGLVAVCWGVGGCGVGVGHAH